MNEELNPGNVGTGTETVSAGTEATPATVSEPVQSTEPVQSKPERTFTKSQVNDLMKKRVERSHNAFFNRYGVKDLTELDNLIGQSRSYGPLKERFDELDKNHNELNNSYKDLTKRYAYKVSNIDESKIADIETYFKGKGIDIDENTLVKELKTHPDWVAKVATIKQLGAEVQTQDENDMKAEAARIFGVNFHR